MTRLDSMTPKLRGRSSTHEPSLSWAGLVFFIAACQGQSAAEGSSAAPSQHSQAGATAQVGVASEPALPPSNTLPVDAGRPPVLIGDGLLLDEGPQAQCFAVCGFPRQTDPDLLGNLDGFGYEGQRPCIADGTTLALSLPRCDVVPLPNRPAPGSGIYRETACLPTCASSLTDRDGKTGVSDGWGYERRRNCIVPGTAAALGGLPCDPGEPPFPHGDGIDIVVGGKTECRPLCRSPAQSDPDADGFGYEHEQSCIVSASVAALQGIPCDAPDLPAPPAPPPPPPGAGWQSSYTATMFGELDCARFGFDDPGDSDLSQAACVSTRAVELDAANQVYFGATGDLASLWTGPPCVCSGSEKAGVCRTPPACPKQGNCGQCVEVTCNFEGQHSFQNDGVTHNEFCRPGQSVVVQLIDACPHNHPNNPYWCTRAATLTTSTSAAALSAR